MPPPPQISQWVRHAYPKPRVDDDWLDACCTWIADELRLDPATQTQEFISNVETQLLESNLCDSMVEGTGLPMNALTMNNERIRGPPVLVEVTAVTEIGHSAFNLQNVRQTRIERADLAGSRGPSTASTAASTTQVLARALSPARGARIDVDIDIGAGVDDFEEASRVRRSETAAGKQRQVTSTQGNSYANAGDGSGSVARNTFEEFDFGSDADIDAAFLDEVEKVEKAALENSQMQSKAASQTYTQVRLDRPAGVRVRTPAPAPAIRRLQSQPPAQATSHTQSPVSSQPRAHSQRPQAQAQLRTRPVPQDVITIEDDDEDDKENVPVPKRRVRRRISTTSDDVVIDLSD
ncbi:hypothetical protein M0805_009853 [Coniferiporia weirii]|nr:hypothetical protein M0805_009853 [Coniferiporia weirii]